MQYVLTLHKKMYYPKGYAGYVDVICVHSTQEDVVLS